MTKVGWVTFLSGIPVLSRENHLRMLTGYQKLAHLLALVVHQGWKVSAHPYQYALIPVLRQQPVLTEYPVMNHLLQTRLASQF